VKEKVDEAAVEIASEKFDKEQQKFIQQTRNKLKGQLALGAIFTVMITLWGADVAEYLRTKLKPIFPQEIQKELAYIIYFSVISICLACSLVFFIDFFPAIFLLLAATLYPFLQYIKYMERDEVLLMKVNMNKIKTLILIVFVIFVIGIFLSDSGLLNITIKSTAR
jgi:uncharacterized membrane protein YidH (DUF202 family)